MVIEVLMPKMADTMEKGKIVKWLKEEGEHVEKGELIFEMETEKTTIEVEARGSGILKKILVPEGEEAPINVIIGYIGEKDEPIPEMPSSKTLTPDVQRTTTMARAEQKKDKTEGRIRASPLAKRIAKEKGVDLSRVTGTGPGGRITQDDVLNYLVVGTAKTTPPNLEEETAFPEFQVVPTTSMRKAIARKMTESKTHAPHFYVSTQVDMTEISKMRSDLMSTVQTRAGVRLSFTHLIVKAVTMTLREFPILNSTFEDETVKQWKDVNAGIAVNLEDGLIVPVLRRAGEMSLFQIASEVDKLVEKAKSKRLRQDEFSGGTFTVSNMGNLDVESFAPIINVPEVAILGVGKISDKPYVVNGELAVRKMVTLTLSVDHRVVDGVQAAKFLQRTKNLLEAPHNLLIA